MNSAPAMALPVSRYSLFLWVNIVIYLVIAGLLLPKGMFSGGELDGFYIQMLHVVTERGADNPLYVVHLFRFLVVSPFYWIYASGYSSFLEAVLMVLFLYPVLTARFARHIPYLQAFYVYLPLIFSFRTVLVMCAMAYLFICLYGVGKSYRKLTLSALLANLSSGVILPWILIVVAYHRPMFRIYPAIRIVVIAAVALLTFSILQKLDFFFGLGGQLGGGESLLGRNTFAVSAQHEQYARLAVYIGLLLLWLYIMLLCTVQRRYREHFFWFMAPVGLLSLVEGLGFVSFLIPMLWFLMGIRPNFCVPPPSRRFRRIVSGNDRAAPTAATGTMEQAEA